MACGSCGHGRGESVGLVEMEVRVGREEDPVGAPFAQLFRAGHDAITQHDGVNCRTQEIRELARGSNDFERDLAKDSSAILGYSEDGGHVRSPSLPSASNRTSSTTASGPSPTILPAGRSAGSWSDWTVRDPDPSDTGFTSSGFFFAAMMPLSAGSRGVFSPLSQVSTAGSEQVGNLDSPFDFPLRLPPRRRIP